MNRTMLFLGIVSLAAAWLVLAPRADHAFWMHMTMHVLVVAVAAPLLALALAGGRFDPVRLAPKLFAPIPVSILELIVVWAWHAPVPHHFARQTIVGLFAEQSMFLAMGLWMWLSAFGGDGADRPRRAAGVIGLLLTSMHMTLLGALIALSSRVLYHHAHGSSLTPLEDQHLGGAIMLIVGGASYLIGGLWLTLGLVRQEPEGTGASK